MGSKIDQAQVFVCDISIINQNPDARLTPNPNVLLELGYALKTLGDKCIIMVLNDAYSRPELLPFDLRMRRVLRYRMPMESEDRATERKRLERHTQGDLAKHVPMEQFTEADYFLFLRAQLQPAAPQIMWVPWSLLYMKHPPRYLREAERIKYAGSGSQCQYDQSPHPEPHPPI